MSQALDNLDSLIGILSARLEKAEAEPNTRGQDFLSSLLSQAYGDVLGQTQSPRVGALKKSIEFVQCVREVAAQLPEEERNNYIGLMGFVVAITTAQNTAPSLLGEMARIIRSEIEEAKA